MTPSSSNDRTPRQRWMAVLARAGLAELQRLVAAQTLPAHTRLRGPESGLVMARGRAGGGGEAFNLGEISVTRCTVRDAAGQVGHATITGRDLACAELAARIDAALQDEGRHDALHAAVIAPLAAAQAARAEANARKAAATRVQFFTLATMRGGS